MRTEGVRFLCREGAGGSERTRGVSVEETLYSFGLKEHLRMERFGWCDCLNLGWKL